MEGVLRPGIEVKVILRQPQHILCSWWCNWFKYKVTLT